MNVEKSKALYAQAQGLMPAGVNSPVRAFKSVGGNPLYIKQGAGAHIIDEDDNTYVDYCMSWGPLILGHADPDVIRAITEEAKNGTSFGTPNRHEIEIARMVTHFFPSIEMVRFVNSGTEATMSAIRLARGVTGKNKIIKCDGCYHGHADYLLVAAGSGLATFGTPDSAGVTPENARDTLIVPYNDNAALEAVMAHDHQSIAAVIMEPVPCNYGLIPPRPGYLKAVRELCDHYGILLILDEVISGFRIAPGGAQEYYGVKADITTLGKIIGGGLPVGAYGASKAIMEKIAPLGPVYQAGTLSGNPLAMIAGITTLSKFMNGSVHRILAEKRDRFSTLLKPIQEKYEGKVLFVALESIFACYFTQGQGISSLADVKASDMKLFAQFHRLMLERGIYLAPSGYEVGFLSTAHTDEDLTKTAQAIEESLKRIFQ